MSDSEAERFNQTIARIDKYLVDNGYGEYDGTESDLWGNGEPSNTVFFYVIHAKKAEILSSVAKQFDMALLKNNSHYKVQVGEPNGHISIHKAQY